jgi:hypothetical protein
MNAQVSLAWPRKVKLSQLCLQTVTANSSERGKREQEEKKIEEIFQETG